MNHDHLRRHLELTELSRRDALKLAGAGAAAALGSSIVGAGPAGAVEGPATAEEAKLPPSAFTDVMFDVAAVEAGAWAPSIYGRGDQRGAFNEVTPEKTTEALRLLDPKKPTKTYNLGELLFNGFPAYRTIPPRVYEQRLVVLGYDPGPEFEQVTPDDYELDDPSKGFLQGTEPSGPNRIGGHEERFPLSGTYQIGTQLDNLNHVGVGGTFYNGFRGPDIAEPYGTNKLGNEHMGPIITRGLVFDILGLKQSQGARGDYFTAPNGEKVLRDNYRITIEDIEAARKRQNVSDVRPGDVVLFRTGWTHLVRDDPDRYLAQEPGIFLREARYLAARRPAIIGSDVWGLEVLDPEVTKGVAFPVHQVLLARHGIRIGEGVRTESLVGDGVFEYVHIVTPQYAKGATAGNTPPAGLASRR